MGYYWIRMGNGKAGTVEADGEAAAMAKAALLNDGIEIKGAQSLPYPASPVIFQEPGTPDRPQCPLFCYSPNVCAGRTSCPKNYACSE